MKKFVIKKNLAHRPSRETGYPRGYSAVASEDESGNCGCLCFFLGFIMGPIGLIVAAIIGKASGVKSALLGWFIGWVLVALIWFGAAALLTMHG